MKQLCVFCLCISMQFCFSQTDKELIEKTLMDYIEGTANGAPDRIKQAFHQDLNLYSITNDTLSVTDGQKYIGYFKEGQKRDRVGKIVSIDMVNNAAVAKVEIDVPTRKRLYTDYMMLLKVKGKWKIIHKSYTHENY